MENNIIEFLKGLTSDDTRTVAEKIGYTQQLEKAIEKLESEISESKNPYIQLIGNYLKSYIENNPSFSTLILSDGKTIKGSLDTMASIAEERAKAAKSNFSMLSDDEGYSIVIDYFKNQDKLEPQTIEETDNSLTEEE